MPFTYYAKRRLIGEKIKNSSSPRKTELSKQWLYFFAWRPNWRSSNVGKRDASKEPTPSIFESKGSAFKFFLRGRSVQSPTLPAKKGDVFPPRSCRYDPFAAVAEGLFFVRGRGGHSVRRSKPKAEEEEPETAEAKKKRGGRGKFPSFDRPSTSSACHHCTERETSNPITGKRERAGESKGGRGGGTLDLWLLDRGGRRGNLAFLPPPPPLAVRSPSAATDQARPSPPSPSFRACLPLRRDPPPRRPLFIPLPPLNLAFLSSILLLLPLGPTDRSSSVVISALQQADIYVIPHNISCSVRRKKGGKGP